MELRSLNRTTALLLSVAACQSEQASLQHEGDDAAEALAYGQWGDPFENVAANPQQLQSVCSRPGNDVVRDTFCSAAPAQINSLADLEAALGVGPTGVPGRTGTAVTANSTSLSARSVSAIN